MANETVGASFSIDTTQLKAGLAEANRAIRESESNFRAAAAGMDDWTKSEEGLTKRQEALTDQIDIQKAKVEALTKAKQEIIDKMKAEGKSQEEIEKAVDAANKQITNESKQLDKLKSELAKTNKSIEEFADATDEIVDAADEAADSLDDLGNKAEGAGGKLDKIKSVGGAVGKGVLAIGSACAAAVGGFLSLGESTKETQVAMSKLEQSFATAKLSTEDMNNTMNSLYGVLGDMDRATEASNLLAKMSDSSTDLEANTRILTGVFAEFGDSIPTEGLAEGMQATAQMGTVQGVLADALEWQGINLDDYNAKLGAMSSAEERAAYIQETLIGLYGESADSYAENNKALIESNQAQLALNQSLAEIGKVAMPIMTQINTMLSNLLTSIMPFVQLIGEGLTGAINGVDGATQKLADGIGGVLTSALDTIMQMLPTALSVVVQIIPTIVNAIAAQLPLIVNTVMTLIPQIVDAVTAMIPTLVSLISVILPQIVTAIIDGLPQVLQAAITLLMGIVEAIPTIIQNLVAALPALINSLVGFLVQSIPQLIDGAIQLLMAIVDAIPVIIDALINNLPAIINAIITGLIQAMPLLQQGAIKMFMAIVNAIPTIIQSLATAVPKIVKSIGSTLASRAPEIATAAVKLFGGMVKGIAQFIPTLISNIPKIITSIVNGLKSGITSIASVGKDLIKGLWNGISDMAGWIKSKIEGFGKGVLNNLKSFFGIKSPSRVMRDEIGVQLAAGIAAGIEKGEDEAVKKADEMASKVLSAAQSNLNNYKAYNVINTDEEAQYWNSVRSQIQEGTQARITADKKYFETLEKAETDFLSQSQKDLDNWKVYHDVSIADEVQYWDEVRKLIKEGTQARIDADKKYFDSVKNFEQEQEKAEKEHKDKIEKTQELLTKDLLKVQNEYTKKLEKINDKRIKLEENYRNKVKEINKQTIADIEKLQNDYESKLESRKDSLFSAFDLFDMAEFDEAKSGEELKTALQSQVDALTAYSNEINKLKRRGINSDLLAELQNKGVSATGYIQAINAMSDEDLKQYNALYSRKRSLADKQAETEMQGLLKSTNEQIKAIRAYAKQKKKELRQEFNEDLTNLNTEYANTVNEMIRVAVDFGTGYIDDFHNLGVNLIDGMIAGFSENAWMFSDAVTNSILDAVKDAQKAAGIHSPSKLFRDKIGINLGLGLAEGVKESTSSIISSVKKQIENIQGAYSGINGLNAALNGSPEAQAGKGNVIINQTNNYSQAHSRYEIYKSKQQTAAAVRLAMVGV